MMTDLLSFGLDIVILAALGVTIFFAIRLSNALNKLRLNKEEFHQFMEELAQNISAAEDAIHNLKQASLATGEQLRRKVREGQHLHDELEIMIETAGNIADRLEQSAEGAGKAKKTQKKSRKAKIVEDSTVEKEPNDWVMEDVGEKEGSSRDDDELPSFFIKDQDHELAEPSAPEEMQSQAERELYEALQAKKKTKKQAS